MKLRLTIYLFSLLLTLSASARQSETSAPGDNPFLPMIGQAYGDYHAGFWEVKNNYFTHDAESLDHYRRLLDEAAAADPTGEWALNARLMGCHAEFMKKTGGAFIGGEPALNYIRELREIGEAARRAGVDHVRYLSMYDVPTAYRLYLQDYEAAFEGYLALVEELDKITTPYFPMRPHYYNDIARIYYNFHDYDKAVEFYERNVNDPDVSIDFRMLLHAYNGLGLCYRKASDLDSSDASFRKILNYPNHPDIWGAIAEGNLGHNRYLAGDFDEALRLILPVIDRITLPIDYPFAGTKSTLVADIFLKKGDLRRAGDYIARAEHYIRNAEVPGVTTPELHTVKSKYYAAMGNASRAALYIDSVSITLDARNEAFNAMKLKRVEQKRQAEELRNEKFRSDLYQRSALLSMALLIIAVAFTIVYRILYRRMRNAYAELVRRSMAWAGVKGVPELSVDSSDLSDPSGPSDPPATLASETDHIIMESVEKAMTADSLYKHAGLSLDLLSEHVGHKRYYISAALNHCTGKNFNTYVNEYRVKEAIRIMSEKTDTIPTIDSISMEAGFNDRKTFHRVFKKVTGLSPGDFRRNMNED